MKRLLLMTTLFVIALSAMAQDTYHPLLKEGRVWVENSFSANIVRWVFALRIGEDTIINNIKYYKVYETSCYYDDVMVNSYQGKKVNYKESLRCLIRESDSKKVYRYDNGTDVLLYDFSLPVGMSLERPGNRTQTVTAIDTIVVNNCNYNRMTITEVNWDEFNRLVESGIDPELKVNNWKHTGYWVEGIGSNRGLIDSYAWGPFEGRSALMQACYDQGELVFRSSDFEDPNIKPMLMEGKEWVYDYHHYEESEGGLNDRVSTISYYIEGDTIINNRQYFRLKNTSKYPSQYSGALREEGTTVYCIYPDTEEEVVIQELDPSKNPIMYGNCSVKKDTVIVRDRPYVRYHYQSDEYSPTLTAIEGIGYQHGGIALGMNYERPTCICDYMEFRYCRDENSIFFNSDFDTQQILKVEQIRDTPANPLRKTDTHIFDLQGRRIQGQPQKGMYIQGGKKYVK